MLAQVICGAVEAEAVVIETGGDILRAHDGLLKRRHQATEFRAFKSEGEEWRLEQIEQRPMGKMLLKTFQPARQRRGRAGGRKRPAARVLQPDVGAFQQGA